MKKFNLTIFLAIFATLVFSQNLTQTIRGMVVDTDNKLPIIGANILIANTDPLIGTSTDVDGHFRLENIPVGRITLQLFYLGYENKSIPNVIVNSGKEVVLNIDLQESVVKMEEIVVKAYKDKGAASDDMSLISARSISIEETKRFAGGFDDPARILSNFAGVTNTQDGSNDIIVRGNSPKYIQWRLEGIQITNPNHFADQNGLSGGVSTLNNNLLANSDFYTGAFSPEYGNVLSGIYDIKLRAGNNEKFEATVGVGLLGTDLILEGPLKKGYGGSYLINYKYSTIGLISDLGLVDIDGDLTFQDATFKIVLPTKKAGVFSIFGLGGLSSFLLEDVKPSLWITPSNEPLTDGLSEDFYKKAHLANLGMTNTLPINENSYLKTTLSYSSNGIDDDVFRSKIIKITNNEGGYLRDSVVSRQLNYISHLDNSIYRGAMTYSNKLNAKNKIQIGTKYSWFKYNNQQSFLQEDATRFTAVDFNENVGVLQNFISWKHRLNEKITIVAGLQNMNVLLNHKSTLEPRIALDWKLTNTISFNAGYGNHSQMEGIQHYFTKVAAADGTISQPNKDLGLLKAHHFVMGLEKRFTPNVRAKVEVYYQDLYNLPVENNDTSYYATINEGLDAHFVDLVNKGRGKNYGVEVTLERFMSNNYYFLINASLYDSKYTALDNIERNTQYNGNYLANILFGKEFVNLGKKKNQTLALNTRIFYGGGKKYIPLLRDANGNLAVDPENGRFYDYEKAYQDKIEDVFQMDISASYKFNKPKSTHEIYLNLINVTNATSNLLEFYDENEKDLIGHQSQFGFFPNLLYRVYF